MRAVYPQKLDCHNTLINSFTTSQQLLMHCPHQLPIKTAGGLLLVASNPHTHHLTRLPICSAHILFLIRYRPLHHSIILSVQFDFYHCTPHHFTTSPLHTTSHQQTLSQLPTPNSLNKTLPISILHVICGRFAFAFRPLLSLSPLLSLPLSLFVCCCRRVLCSLLLCSALLWCVSECGCFRFLSSLRYPFVVLRVF